MFNKHRNNFFEAYNKIRDYFIEHPDHLTNIEHHIATLIKSTIEKHKAFLKQSYDEASYLYPFWQNYPPEDRGRSPRGDQYPWIEVGEHAIGQNLARFLSSQVDIREIGLPSGTDQRFVIKDEKLKTISGITDTVLLFLDVKSVGPRDDFEHTVLSPYQVSGDGVWTEKEEGIKNSILSALGRRASHEFHCALPPIFVLTDGSIAPTVSIFLKPRYDMIYDGSSSRCVGQPLKRITIISLPNGLLLTVKPNYLEKFQGLFYPGKDDKSKAKNKARARVSFDLLRKVDAWRVITIEF